MFHHCAMARDASSPASISLVHSATPFKLSLSSHTSKPIFRRQTKMYKLQS